jgi:hypothetical protein
LICGMRRYVFLICGMRRYVFLICGMRRYVFLICGMRTCGARKDLRTSNCRESLINKLSKNGRVYNTV